MAERFDPYQQWLGIHPDEQPTHYYRLLGVRLFESDTETIETAASRQRAALRKHLTGNQAAAAKKLTELMAKARACLLSPERKAAYDAKLERKLDVSRPSRKAATVQSEPEESSELAFPSFDTSDSKSSAASGSPFDFNAESTSSKKSSSDSDEEARRPIRKKKTQPVALLAVCLVLLIAVGGAAYFVLSDKVKDDPEATANDEDDGGDEANTDEPTLSDEEQRRPEASIKKASATPKSTRPVKQDKPNKPMSSFLASSNDTPDQAAVAQRPTAPARVDRTPATSSNLARYQSAERLLLTRGVSEAQAHQAIASLEAYLSDPNAQHRGKAEKLLKAAKEAVSEEFAKLRIRKRLAAADSAHIEQLKQDGGNSFYPNYPSDWPSSLHEIHFRVFVRAYPAEFHLRLSNGPGVPSGGQNDSNTTATATAGTKTIDPTAALKSTSLKSVGDPTKYLEQIGLVVNKNGVWHLAAEQELFDKIKQVRIKSGEVSKMHRQLKKINAKKGIRKTVDTRWAIHGKQIKAFEKQAGDRWKAGDQAGHDAAKKKIKTLEETFKKTWGLKRDKILALEKKFEASMANSHTMLDETSAIFEKIGEAYGDLAENDDVISAIGQLEGELSPTRQLNEDYKSLDKIRSLLKAKSKTR